MAGTVNKIKIGAAWVTYKGTDLGYTKGGITIEIQTQTHPIIIPHLGNTPIAEPVTGRLATIRVPLAETNHIVLNSLTPETVTIGTDLIAGGGSLVVFSKIDASDNITFVNAIPTGNVSTYYNFDRERVWLVELRGYLNQSGQLFTLSEGS